MTLEQFHTFAALHTPGKPLILPNCWNLASGRAFATGQYPALGTSSYAVADALGYPDGEQLPFEIVVQLSTALVRETQMLITVDAEGGYGPDFCQNMLTLAKVGVVGINLEDQDFQTQGLLPVEEQAKKIAAITETCNTAGYPLFINARTDLFLEADQATEDLCEMALERAAAYKAAGAASIFVPGLEDEALLRYFVAHSPLPVAVMLSANGPSIATLTALGVARISYGPLTYFEASAALPKYITESRAGHDWKSRKN